MQNQLLSIEQNFLNQTEIKEALKLTTIRGLQRKLEDGQKKRFEQSLQLSVYVSTAFEWYKSDEGKAKFREEGIEWTVDDFSRKVFGFQKSFLYKLVKASKVEEAKVEEFKAVVETAKEEGKDISLSIENLLKFAKGENVSGEADGEGEGEGEGESETADQVVTVATFTFKADGGNIVARLDSQGNLKTTNTKDELLQALAVLQSAISELN